ncbi:unnamed protein product [Nippostrongylus brasiliensis]|uniref:Peroxin-19 n=1 Tax=Nippostrongylus brasiliensis TaxID=27835 RepID=A0A158R0A9_NIPBR|nr:unnamed protein product [Nippostrongylus brasiliensis]
MALLSRRPRTTDDELDEIMAKQDQAAAQKAAGDFQAMLQQMVKVQEEAIRQAESTGQHPTDVDKETQEMIVAMKALMESSGKIANASSHDDFVAGLDMLKAPGSPMEPFMSMILQSLASKAVMYPPLKEIYDNYPAFFKDHGASLDKETRERYEKQQEVLGKICKEFENQPDEPVTGAGGDGSGGSNGVPDMSNFETLGKLLVELQSYGYPPKELTGELPAGWSFDDNTGLPKVEDISAAANACVLIGFCRRNIPTTPGQMSISYVSSVDRAYKRYACEDYDNVAYLHHPSGVSVVVLRQKLESEVVEVDFGNTKKNGISRMDHVVIGKGKKGGLHLQKETRLCTIRCKDGKEFVIRAGVRGVLTEVNDRLVSNPDLVRTAPENQGYIAIITFGAGKRKPDEYVTELPAKQVFLENYEHSSETKVLN